jgi:hypothetical protein
MAGEMCWAVEPAHRFQPIERAKVVDRLKQGLAGPKLPLRSVLHAMVVSIFFLPWALHRDA